MAQKFWDSRRTPWLLLFDHSRLCRPLFTTTFLFSRISFFNWIKVLRVAFSLSFKLLIFCKRFNSYMKTSDNLWLNCDWEVSRSFKNRKVILWFVSFKFKLYYFIERRAFDRNIALAWRLKVRTRLHKKITKVLVKSLFPASNIR